MSVLKQIDCGAFGESVFSAFIFGRRFHTAWAELRRPATSTAGRIHSIMGGLFATIIGRKSLELLVTIHFQEAFSIR